MPEDIKKLKKDEDSSSEVLKTGESILSDPKDSQKAPVNNSKQIVIDFERFIKQYPGEIKAVDNISFKIGIGELFIWLGLVGPVNLL
jgi:ABC-type glutathione transport system ATPase component